MVIRTERAGDWIPVERRQPDDGQKVEWIAPSGQVVQGKYHGRLWFLEGGMYVYYEPVFWRPLQ